MTEPKTTRPTVNEVLQCWRDGSVTADEAMAALQRENLLAEAFMRMADCVLDISNRKRRPEGMER